MLKVIVRKFETEKAGSLIVSYLEAAGFRIEEKISPKSDSMGGLIETNVVDEFNVANDESEIIALCRGLCPGCLVEWERFEVIEEGSSDDDAEDVDGEVKCKS